LGCGGIVFSAFSWAGMSFSLVFLNNSFSADVYSPALTKLTWLCLSLVWGVQNELWRSVFRASS
jgi:hypothetical protein